jgi:hypothetical protein
MRTETKTIKIYNFDELSEEVKRKLIEKEIEYQHEAYCEDFLENEMKYYANELLKKYFKENKAELKNVYYSLSYCQGDGAMFEFDLYYYNKYVQIQQYGHYYHRYSFTIADNYELTEKQEKQLKEKVLKMFKEFEDYGWSLVDYKITEAEAIEILQENEYLEDGSIY